MANTKGNHSQLKKWKKGQSGNPGGRVKIPDELRKIKNKYSSDMIKAMLAKALDMTKDELKEKLSNPKAKNIDHMIGKIVQKAIHEGDQMRFNFILDRMIGKPKEEQEIKIIEPFIIESYDKTKKITLGVKNEDE